MVYASKREESSARFLVMNDELFYKTLTMCAHCPKSYRYIITDEIIKLENEFHSNITMANSIYINQYTSRKDYELKLNYWSIAIAHSYALEKKINLFFVLVKRGNDFFNNKKDYMEKFEDWIKKVKALRKTLKKLVQNDKNKFGKIQAKQRQQLLEREEREKIYSEKKMKKKIEKEERIEKENQKILDDCDI